MVDIYERRYGKVTRSGVLVYKDDPGGNWLVSWVHKGIPARTHEAGEFSTFAAALAYAEDYFETHFNNGADPISWQQMLEDLEDAAKTYDHKAETARAWIEVAKRGIDSKELFVPIDTPPKRDDS